VSIRDIQQRFCSYLLDAPSDIARELDRDGDAGLAVYHNAYRAQLVACLRDTFERVWAWLGDEAFEVAARTHIGGHPPRSWTLADYGEQFPQTLTALYPQDPECTELAALEWQLRRAFGGPDSKAVELGSLSGVNWDDALLRFVPTLRVVPVTTNCGAIWMALAAGNTPPGVERLAAGAAMRIWRVGFSSRFCTIDAVERRVISLVQKGATFGTVCNVLAEGDDASRVTEAAGQLLAAWLREGMIAAIDTQKEAESYD
jgi:hypothetical protein